MQIVAPVLAPGASTNAQHRPAGTPPPQVLSRGSRSIIIVVRGPRRVKALTLEGRNGDWLASQLTAFGLLSKDKPDAVAEVRVAFFDITKVSTREMCGSVVIRSSSVYMRGKRNADGE